MPLSIKESKELLVKIFRLTLATAERRPEDAVTAFSDILDSAIECPAVECPAVECCNNISEISHHDSMYDDMPALVPIQRSFAPSFNPFTDDEVKLVISEEPVAAKPLSVDYNVADGTRVVYASAAAVETQEEEAAAAADEEQEEEAAAADEEQEEAAEEEEEEEEAADEEQEEEAGEEQEEDAGEELQLVPVRIKKVTYWKDELTGDIYQYLPDDECGDKVGTYVDGKPVFA